MPTDIGRRIGDRKRNKTRRKKKIVEPAMERQQAGVAPGMTNSVSANADEQVDEDKEKGQSGLLIAQEKQKD